MRLVQQSAKQVLIHDRSRPTAAVGRQRSMLHEPDVIRIRVRHRTGLPAMRTGMAVGKGKISRPAVIGGGIVGDAGSVSLVEIDEKMRVVNRRRRLVNEHKILRRRRNGS